MKHFKPLLPLLFLAALLSGCTGEHRQQASDAFVPPEPGYYLVSSVGEKGDITYFGSLDPENGWLILQEDRTGSLSYGGVEDSLCWDDETLYWNDRELPCSLVTYYDDELQKEDSMLFVIFDREEISVIFRAAE